MEEQLENKAEDKKVENKPETKPEKPKAFEWGEKIWKEKIMKSKNNLIFLALILVLILAGLGYQYHQKKEAGDKLASQNAVKEKVLNYIKTNLVQPGTDIKITAMEDQGSMYKIALSVGSQSVTTYATKDGKEFFPEAMDMDAKNDQAANPQQATAAATPAQKADVPSVNLFVMSYCPYGTQMEKGILPVLSALGNKINFKLEFVDYSMHNDPSTGDRKELDENLRQYCIEKNQPDKLESYLSCFLQKGQGTESACMTQSGVNAASVSACMAQTDTQFNVTKDFKDQSTYQGQFPPFEVNKADNDKYGVQGSPTLVINGTTVNPSGRDPESMLKTICSGFNNPPAECQKALSGTAPAAGFGNGSTPASSPSSGGASCGQ